jgi:predicted DNA-binding transcriptional regulator YafY
VNRTDRLYALVEVLRADPGRPRSATALARRFEVSRRTVERDLRALQEAGVPVYAEPGRRGGYLLDRGYSLPPLNVDAAELVALALAATALEGTPLRVAARSALGKVRRGMAPAAVRAAHELARRVRLLDGPVRPAAALPAVPLDRVVRLDYVDRAGRESTRLVEPVGYVVAGPHWYVVAWCRARGAPRVFRADRIRGHEVTADPPAHRPASAVYAGTELAALRPLELA